MGCSGLNWGCTPQTPSLNKQFFKKVLEIPGYEIDFENVEILDRADTTRKLEYKEILFIRKLKPTINKQTEGELFTLIMRNVKLESSMERDIQKNY